METNPKNRVSEHNLILLYVQILIANCVIYLPQCLIFMTKIYYYFVI